MDKIPTVALLAALAIRESITELQLVRSATDVLIKWPNDVVLEQTDGMFHKVCGISSEFFAGGVCVGMGINVLRQAGVQTDGRYLPGYLSDVAGARFEELAGFDARGALKEQGAQLIAQAVIDTLLGFLPEWEEKGFAPFADKYNNCSYLYGKRVAVANIMDAVQTEGTVCGVDALGRLLIETPQDQIVPIIAGEAHLV